MGPARPAGTLGGAPPDGVVLALHLPRWVTHSFVVLLTLGAALASSMGVGQASRLTSLGGRGFLASWQGGIWEQWPVDGNLENLRTPLVLQTQSSAASAVTDASPSPVAPAAPTVASAVPSAPSGETADGVALAVVPLPEKKREVVTYEVASGDTLTGVAARFGISTNTILWANDLKSANSLGLGDKLKVLPVDGMLHTVKPGENLGAIAARYKVAVEDILDYPENGLASADRLQVGQELVVPGATKPPPPPPAVQAAIRPAEPAAAPAPAPAAAAPPPAPAPEPAPKAAPPGGGFVWPTRGPIFTYFSGWHPGVDISPPYGTPVVAVQGGVVTDVKYWNYSYGFHILVDHGGGYSAMYAHLSEILVKPGESVGQGQLIGRVGSTGRSTGPHLHFELYRGGGAIDPLGVLK